MHHHLCAQPAGVFGLSPTKYPGRITGLHFCNASVSSCRPGTCHVSSRVAFVYPGFLASRGFVLKPHGACWCCRVVVCPGRSTCLTWRRSWKSQHLSCEFSLVQLSSMVVKICSLLCFAGWWPCVLTNALQDCPFFSSCGTPLSALRWSQPGHALTCCM